jgi:ribosomal protein S18 acetylase RimI-like enzyme
MSEFYISITNEEMAKQIDVLLNSYNKLYKQHNIYTILNANTKYFVELLSSPAIDKKVIGCVGLWEEYSTLSKIKHVCVDQRYRRFGVARKLIKLAIENSPTDLVYMTIREDNNPSLYLAKSLGFVFVTKEYCRDHFIITVARRKECGH